MASLQSIREDDLVEVDIQGRRAVCWVRGKEDRQLVLDPITPNFTWRRATGRQVVNHWRKTKNTRRSRAGSPDA